MRSLGCEAFAVVGHAVIAAHSSAPSDGAWSVATLGLAIAQASLRARQRAIDFDSICFIVAVKPLDVALAVVAAVGEHLFGSSPIAPLNVCDGGCELAAIGSAINDLDANDRATLLIGANLHVVSRPEAAIALHDARLGIAG